MKRRLYLRALPKPSLDLDKAEARRLLSQELVEVLLVQQLQQLAKILAMQSLEDGQNLQV